MAGSQLSRKTEKATAVTDVGLSLACALVEAQAEAADAALLAVTANNVILSVNEPFSQLWNVPTAVLEQRSLSVLKAWLTENGDDMATVVAKLLSLRDSADSGELTSDSGRVLHFRVVPFRGEQAGTATQGCVWSLQDVTFSRDVGSALRDAEHWLRLFALHTDGIVLELDGDARFVGIWANDATTFFEQADAALEGSRLTEAIGEAPGVALEACVQRVLATGQPEHLEYMLELRGERRFFAANAVMLQESDTPRVTLLIRDVTERARMQTQLLQAERLASVGLLAAGVAHEINNPLGYVLLNLYRIQNGLRELQQGLERTTIVSLLDAVKMSLEGSQRVQEIVSQLRDFSGSNHAEQWTPLDLHRTLTFAMEMAFLLVRDRGTLIRNFGTTPLVLASEGGLSQVFLNLLVNAAQAIPEGAPESNRIEVTTSTDRHGRAVIAIADTGKGIPAATLPHIFDPFFTTKAPGSGTGLGLAICHGIVSGFGGDITVESEEGRGSVFCVRLPAAHHAPADPSAPRSD